MPTTVQIALIAAVGAAASAAFAGPTPQFYNLGEGAGGTSISDNGVVAGIHDGFGQYFYLTAAGGLTLIGGVHPNQGYGGQASISNDGMRIAGTNINADTNLGEAAIYDRNTGSWTNLGGIGGSIDASTSSGWGISGDGNHVVGLGWLPNGQAHAIRWNQNDGMVDMGSTSPGQASRANAANGDGSVIGGWQDNDLGRVGAVWVNGVQRILTDGDGNPVSEALSISDDGQWVTGVTYGIPQTYRYNTFTDTMEYIDPVDGGFFFPTALGAAISDDGRTIIGSVRDFGPPIFGTGFIWREGLGVMSIADFFNYSGVDIDPGMIFSMPFAMSGDGLTFSGLALSSDFQVVGWVVTIPAPSSAAALGLAGLVGLRRRR
ncbi:MAG: hypothetical protein IBJ10_11075 [Phycisphaerales bacterium]|nr:hypothetical protein [Phycisphaerales bacterium]